jgi:hypothetical protein
MKNMTHVNPKTGVTRYKLRETKMRKQTPRGEVSYVYESDSSLIFKLLTYAPKGAQGSMGGFNTQDRVLSLKCKDGKFNLYAIREGKHAINVTPQVPEMIRFLVYGKKGNSVETAKVRCQKILKNFLKKNNINKEINKNVDIDTNILELCYPGVNGLPLWIGYTVHKSYTQKLKNSKDFKEVVWKCFGWKDVDLYNRVSYIAEETKSLDILALGMILRGFLTLAEVKDILNSEYFKGRVFGVPSNASDESIIVLDNVAKGCKEVIKSGRYFLNGVPASDRLSVMKGLITGFSLYNFSSAVKKYRDYKGAIPLPTVIGDCNTFNKYIESVAKTLKYPTFKYNVPEAALGVDGVEIEDGFRIILPRDSDVVADWYDKLALGKSTVRGAKDDVYYMGFEVNDELTYLALITSESGSLQSLYAEGHACPDVDTSNLTKKFLIERGVLDERYLAGVLSSIKVQESLKKKKNYVPLAPDPYDPFEDE